MGFPYRASIEWGKRGGERGGKKPLVCFEWKYCVSQCKLKYCVSHCKCNPKIRVSQVNLPTLVLGLRSAAVFQSAAVFHMHPNFSRYMVLKLASKTVLKSFWFNLSYITSIQKKIAEI